MFKLFKFWKGGSRISKNLNHLNASPFKVSKFWKILAGALAIFPSHPHLRQFRYLGNTLNNLDRRQLHQLIISQRVEVDAKG